jgi:hypothetical protein
MLHIFAHKASGGYACKSVQPAAAKTASSLGCDGRRRCGPAFFSEATPLGKSDSVDQIGYKIGGPFAGFLEERVRVNHKADRCPIILWERLPRESLR